MLLSMIRVLFKLLVLSALLLGMPILGVWLAGKPVAPYLQLPPRTGLVTHAPFSVLAFTVLAAAALTSLAIPLLLLRKGLKARASRPGRRAFPLWGWLGVTLLGASWLVAWGAFAPLQSVRPFAFPPLWLGYVLCITAAAHALGGHTMLTRRPACFLALFPLSALFWWYFEFLNRFVENWHYIGISDQSGGVYALHATLAYSTVLPAVWGTTEWLYALLRPGPSGPILSFPRAFQRKLAWLGVLGAAAALVLIGVYPNQLYSLLWIAPLLLLLGLQTLMRERGLLASVAHGDWRPLYLPALASLQCGLLWEMWNFYSAAKWVYTIPYVQRFPVFEMPLLGYAGYLPFGIECAAVATLIRCRYTLTALWRS